MTSIDSIPELVLHWLRRTQLAGIDIVAVATHQLPMVGSLDFINVAQLGVAQFSRRPKQVNDSLNQLLAKTTASSDQQISTTPLQPLSDSIDVAMPKAVPVPAVEPPAPSELEQHWQTHIGLINATQPIKLQRIQDCVLVSCLVAEQAEHTAIIGCVIAPPFHDAMLDMLQLSLGWLFYGFVIDQHPEAERAKQLLELLVDILAQPNAQAAAQEWVNQLKRIATALEQNSTDIGISLFKAIRHTPKWWVSANIAWAVKGSPKMQAALEMAALTIVEANPQQRENWWSYPLLHQGDVFAVLLLEHNLSSEPQQSSTLYQLIQASADILSPVFYRWQQAEQNIVQHSYRSSTSLLQKIVGKGYLAYKLLAVIITAILLAITLIPVEDVVNAPLYLEGDKRYTITTPQKGYLGELMVRPGDTVKQGQILAKLEDKDLKLEASELKSQLEQSDGQFRQAMADMDAANSGLAVNQKQQTQAKLDLLQSKLDRTSIKAPINGVVVSGDWQQKIGTPIEEGAELFQIADVQNYRVILHVPDKDMDSLQVGQHGKMKLTSLPEQTFDFTITRLTAVAEVKDGENGFSVEAILDSHPPQLNPGMQGVGKIHVGTTNFIGAWSQSLIDWLRLKAWSVW